MNTMRAIRRTELLLETIAQQPDYHDDVEKPGARHSHRELLAQLAELEEKTGYQRSDSPLAAPAWPEFPYREDLVRPVLPVRRADSVDSLLCHAGNHVCLLSLTWQRPVIRLLYQDSILADAFCLLYSGDWRCIMHNIRRFGNIPLRFPCKGILMVDGYALLESDTGQKHNAMLLTEKAICLQPPAEALMFYAASADFGLYDECYVKASGEVTPVPHRSRMERLMHLRRRGFSIRPMQLLDFPGVVKAANPERIPELWNIVQDSKREVLLEAVSELQAYAAFMETPASGVILSYDDVDYSQRLATHDGKMPDRCYLTFDALERALRCEPQPA